ncbi:MAG: murein biosynthesis integral membrane protein MurJ [Amylibacter sp.]
MNKPPKKIKLVSAFFTVGIWTLLSRIAGFVRDILIAAFFGSGPIAEAFQVAFALPNMFRRFFAEGAFNMAFVPMFSKKLETGEGAQEFAQDAFAGLASILIVLTLIAQIFMPWFVWAMASGFVGDARFDVTVDFARICFPYILFISLAALLSGVLNASGRFAAAAAAPVLLNIIVVSAMAGAYYMDLDVGSALIWSIPVAGIAQMALVWWAADKAGLRLVPRLPKMTPELKKLAIIAAPAVLAGGVIQINLLVGRQVASYFDGAIQWLAVADRLYQLPLGVVGIAIGVVLLPDLSRKIRTNDIDGGRYAFNRAAEFALALTIPSAVALFLAAKPMISVLFERGAFNGNDTAATAAALAIYSLGLPAFVFQKVIQPLYFAREDTKTPFYYALVAMIVNLIIAIGLSYKIGYLSAAIAVTISAWGMACMLWFGTRNMGEAAKFDTRFFKTVPKIILASAIMGLTVILAQQILGDALYTKGLRYMALLALVISGAATYGIALLGLKAYSLQEIKAIVKRA